MARDANVFYSNKSEYRVTNFVYINYSVGGQHRKLFRAVGLYIRIVSDDEYGIRIPPRGIVTNAVGTQRARTDDRSE